MPSAEASPRPWRVEQPGDECRFWTIRNPDGISVCTAWREADAALIVDAVNERERLRAIVLMLCDEVEKMEGRDTVVRTDRALLIEELIGKARDELKRKGSRR